MIGQRPDKRPIIGLAMSPDQWIREEALARGWRLLNLLHVGNRGMPEIRVSGVISESPLSPEVLSLHRKGIPVVRLGELFDEGLADIPAVLYDMKKEGRLAAEHYCERGFRHVGFFGMNPWGAGRTVYKGFHDRANELGMKCHLLQFKLKSSVRSNVRQRLAEKQHGFTDWIKSLPKPIGLLSRHSWFSTCFCSWSEQAGFTVPDEVAVISAECDSGICECSIPSITTVDRDVENHSRSACQILAEIMEGKAAENPCWIVPRGITERESTNMLATKDRDVAKALRYMWDHLDMSLSIEDVAKHVGLSSRQLERRFHDALGRGVNAELQRRRLQVLSRLLVSTQTPIADLAPMLGFGSTSYLHRVFRKAYGTTPAKYRREGHRL